MITDFGLNAEEFAELFVEYKLWQLSLAPLISNNVLGYTIEDYALLKIELHSRGIEYSKDAMLDLTFEKLYPKKKN